MIPAFLLSKTTLYVVAGAGILGSAALGGWTANGWRWEARWSEREAQIATDRDAARQALIEAHNAKTEALAQSDIRWTEEVRKLTDENAKLYARKPLRVRVRNECPAPASVPESGPSSRVDHGTSTAELAPEIQAVIPGIDRDIGHVIAQLGACQEQLRIRQ